MSTNAPDNKIQNNKAPPAPASAPRAYTAAATSGTAAVSGPTPPPAPVTLAGPGVGGPQHFYGHYVQLHEASLLSSLKKAPLATIVDNPAEDEGGEEGEFGKISGRKLDSSFAEGSTSTSTIQNDNMDNDTAQHRAPTPLLLSPDSSTGDVATAPSSKVGASEDKMRSTRTKMPGSLNESRSTDAPPSAKLADLDAMTSHNLEVFQATKKDIEAFDSVESVRMLGTSTSKTVTVGQVGFRCVHCFAREGPIVASGMTDLCVVYPASVGTISTALRHMRDHHFDVCLAMPKESKNAFADARREQEEQDAGSSGRRCRKSGDNGPDEWRRIAFLDFCVDFCQRKDIINVQPQRSGLKYRLLMPARSLDAVVAASTPTRDTSAALPNQGNSTPTPARNKFPFFYDNYGAWICRYCCSVPYPYRGQGSVWNAPNQAPPTKEFVDQHMKLCRGGAPLQSQRGTMRAPPSPHTPQMPPLPGCTADVPPHRGASTPQPHFRVSPQILRSPYMSPLGAPHSYNPKPSGRPLPAHPPAGRPPIAPIAATAGKKTQRRGARAPPPTQKELPLPPGVDGTGSDASIQAAINYLVQQESTLRLPPPKDPQIELVSSEDRLLLTDYFIHLIRQLRLVRFSEADRKTRGGKREKVEIGYAGLECIHCIGQPGARKFFWSNVDRLSNSFAEIPGHVYKCNHCAPEIKAALLELKIRHAKQMSQMPRGSQKVFFRRVWRRIHDDDPSPSSVAAAPTSAASTVDVAPITCTTIGSVSWDATKSYVRGDGTTSSTPVRGNDESPNSMERSATKSLASLSKGGSARRTPTSTYVIIGPHAKLVVCNANAFVDAAPSCGTCKHGAEALAHAAAAQSTGEHRSHPIVMLALSEDKEWLSVYDCFLRSNIEVFAADEKDVACARADRKLGISIGQLGIRCLHCAVAVSRFSDGRQGTRGTAVVFPTSTSSIYECVKDFQRNHLENHCPHLPQDVKTKIVELKGTMATSLSSVLRRYYIMAAKALGMIDTAKEGIRAGGVSIPLGSSAEHEYSMAATQAKFLSGDAGHLRAQAANTAATTAGSDDKVPDNTKRKTKVTMSTGAAGLAPVDTSAPSVDTELLAHDEANVATHTSSAPPAHYGFHHYGAYGPPGAVQGSFLASAITPLESRKRVRPKEYEAGDSGPSPRKKTRRTED